MGPGFDNREVSVKVKLPAGDSTRSQQMITDSVLHNNLVVDLSCYIEIPFKKPTVIEIETGNVKYRYSIPNSPKNYFCDYFKGDPGTGDSIITRPLFKGETFY